MAPTGSSAGLLSGFGRGQQSGQSADHGTTAPRCTEPFDPGQHLYNLPREPRELNVSMFVTQGRRHDDLVPKVPMSSEQIVNDLTERIRLGEYPKGSQLPTYAALSKLYDVSPGTIALVMRILRERKVVVGVPGRGTFVPE